MTYKIKLEKFEGPLDLLLFLIQKNEVDIYDIPIALLTQQYLEYLEIIKEQELEGAGDFILMAATLMRIKAQMLLPKSLLDEDEEFEDPRDLLVQQLLEYKRYKEVALEMAEIETQQRLVYPRAFFHFESNGYDGEENVVANVTLYDLITAFQGILKRASVPHIHTVHELDVNIEDRIAFVLNQLIDKSRVSFVDFFSELDTKLVIIVTFLAILQLLNEKKIRLHQPNTFSEIWVSRT